MIDISIQGHFQGLGPDREIEIDHCPGPDHGQGRDQDQDKGQDHLLEEVIIA